MVSFMFSPELQVMLNLSIDSWHLFPSINYSNIYVAGCLAARQTWTAFPSFFPSEVCYETDSCQWNVGGIDECHLWLWRLRSMCVPSPPLSFSSPAGRMQMILEPQRMSMEPQYGKNPGPLGDCPPTRNTRAGCSHEQQNFYCARPLKSGDLLQLIP